MSVPEPTVVCSSGCKRDVLLKQASDLGWECLPITGRWRCPQCWRELKAVNEGSANVHSE